MGFFDINNYYGYSHGKGFWDYASPFIGVIVGSSISIFTSWRTKVSDRKKVADIYISNLKYFQKTMESIMDSMYVYRELYLMRKDGNISIHRNARFDMVKTLDRMALIKYFSKTKEFKKKGDSFIEATKEINNVYYSIDAYCEELNRLTQIISNYEDAEKKAISDVKFQLDILYKHIQNTILTVPKADVEKDKYMTKFLEVHTKYVYNKQINKWTLHIYHEHFINELLQAPLNNRQHYFFANIDVFTTNTHKIIVNFLLEEKIYLARIKEIYKNLNDAYKVIYKKPYLELEANKTTDLS